MMNEQVLARVRAGKRRDYGTLVERYLPVVRAVVYAHLGGHHPDAEDAVQDVFIRAYHSLDKLRDPSRFAQWLAAIARNHCRDIGRKLRESRLTPPQEAALPAAGEDPARKELRELLQARVQALEPPYRETLLLFYYGGMGVAEIAGLQDVSEQAVKKRLQRGREMLSQDMIADLRELLEPAESAKEARCRILRGIAAAPAAWEAGGVAAAAGVVTSIGAGTTKVALFTAFIGVVLGSVWLTLGEEEQSEPFEQASTAIADEEAPKPESEDVLAEPENTPEDADDTASASPASEPAASVAYGSRGGIQPASIEGYVVSRGGERMADMLVFVIEGEPSFYEKSPLSHRYPAALTDNESRFCIDSLEPGAYRLYVQHDPRNESEPLDEHFISEGAQQAGKVWITRANQHITDQRLVFDGERPASAIAGRIMNRTGEPVAGARIDAVGKAWMPRGLRSSSGLAASDDEGQFEITGLGDETYGLRISHDAYDAKRVDAVAAGTLDVEVVLTGLSDITGQVFEAGTRQPLKEFEVSLVTRSNPYAALDVSPSALQTQQGQVFNDANGRYLLENVPIGDDVAVVARAQGYGPDHARVAEVPPEQVINGVDLFLPSLEKGAIEGVVMDEFGEPVSEANVHWGSTPTVYKSSGFPTTRAATTGDDGSFRLEELPPGVYTLSAVHSDSPVVETDVTVDEGETAQVEFALEMGGTITGAVLENGEPVPGAIIHARSSLPGARRADVDADGTYTLTGVPPGETDVNMSVLGQVYRGMYSQTVTVRPGQEVVADFDISEHSAALEGRVTVNGASPTGGEVTLHVPEDGFRRPLNPGSEIDEDGWYWIENLPGGETGTLQVQTWANPEERLGAMLKSVDVLLPQKGVMRYDVDLDSGGATVSGVARGLDEDAAGFIMILPADADISRYEMNPEWAYQDDLVVSGARVTATDNIYSLAGVPPGDYLLVAHWESDAPYNVDFDAHALTITDDESEYVVDVTIPPPRDR